MTAAEFTQQFAEGCYRAGTGHEDVVFVTRRRRQYKGALYFQDGLCVRAVMEGGGDWSFPDHSPLNEIRFLLQFDDEKPLATAVEQGRLLFGQSPEAEALKKEFLANFRIARNLFAHPQFTINGAGDGAALERLIRSAIWLTPKSVAGFNADQFTELGPDRQRNLDAAVKRFSEVAVQVPPDAPATDEQFHEAAGAFAKMLEILEPYVPIPDEARKVENALAEVGKEFPAWVLNWDYELGSDSDDLAAVWVNVYVDDRTASAGQLGRYASEWTTKVRKSLTAAGVDRWPYVRVRTGREHKGAGLIHATS